MIELVAALSLGMCSWIKVALEEVKRTKIVEGRSEVKHILMQSLPNGDNLASLKVSAVAKRLSGQELV